MTRPWLFAAAVPLGILAYAAPDLTAGQVRRERALWTCLGCVTALLLGILVYLQLNPSDARRKPKGEISSPRPGLLQRGDAVVRGTVSELPLGTTLWLIQRDEALGSYNTLAPILDVAAGGQWDAGCVGLMQGREESHLQILLIAVNRASDERLLVGEHDPFGPLSGNFGFGFNLQQLDAEVVARTSVTVPGEPSTTEGTC